jgi:uncharacterized membrane protein
MQRFVMRIAPILLLFAPMSAAYADIIVCNDFRARVRVALAFEGPSGVASAGWWIVEPSACKDIDFVFPGGSFYYAADSDSYKEGRNTMKDHWGNKKELFVPTKDFKTDDAGRKRRDAKPVKFSEVRLSEQQQSKPVLITLRFSSGTTTTQIKFK